MATAKQRIKIHPVLAILILPFLAMAVLGVLTAYRSEDIYYHALLWTTGIFVGLSWSIAWLSYPLKAELNGSASWRTYWIWWLIAVGSVPYIALILAFHKLGLIRGVLYEILDFVARTVWLSMFLYCFVGYRFGWLANVVARRDRSTQI